MGRATIPKIKKNRYFALEFKRIGELELKPLSIQMDGNAGLYNSYQLPLAPG
jgi:hypothetical protein